MPAPTALAAEDLMQLMHAHLRSFVETDKKGFLSTARDPAEIIELLGEAPGRFRVILAWAGEQPVGQRASGIVEHEFSVVVSHNRGLSILKGESVFVQRGDDPPLMTLSGFIRERLRQLAFPNQITDVRLTYGGTVPVQVDGQQIDAFTQTWKLKATLPSALP